jgi:Acyltransferase
MLKPFDIRAFYTNVRGVSIVAPWVLHLLATDILLSALLPLSYLFPTLVYNFSSRLASLVWRGIQTIFTKFNRARITVSGTPLPKNESAIVVSNHVSWADFYLIQHLASASGMLGRCRWFSKQQLRWVPFLGWGLWAMGMPMISRDWDKDQRELDRVFKGPKAFRWPMCQSGKQCSAWIKMLTSVFSRAHKLQRVNTIYSSEVSRYSAVVQEPREACSKVHALSPDQRVRHNGQRTPQIEQH